MPLIPATVSNLRPGARLSILSTLAAGSAIYTAPSYSSKYIASGRTTPQVFTPSTYLGAFKAYVNGEQGRWVQLDFSAPRFMPVGALSVEQADAVIGTPTGAPTASTVNTQLAELAARDGNLVNILNGAEQVAQRAKQQGKNVDAELATITQLANKVIARQQQLKAYQNQSWLQQAGSWASEQLNALSNYLKGVFGFSGFGFLPALAAIPVLVKYALIAGVAVAAISTIYSWLTPANTASQADYDLAVRTLNSLNAKLDTTDQRVITGALEEAYKGGYDAGGTGSGMGSQIGSGVQTALIIGTILVGGGIAYKLGTSNSRGKRR